MSARGRHLRPVLVALGACLSAAAACPPSTQPPAREVSIKPFFKPSCDSICGSTCLACVDAMLVSAVDLEGNNLVDPQCHDIVGRWETLCDLVLGDELLLLDQVPVRGPAIIEIQAFRRPAPAVADAGVDGGAVCTSPPVSDPVDCTLRTTSDLMLWGRSDPVDLSADAGVARVEVKFECRAGCDCLDISRGKAGCPEALRPSACMPGISCDRPCLSDQDCFLDTLACGATEICEQPSLRCDVDAGSCDPDTQGAGVLKPFCGRCSSATECEGNLCIARSGELSGFCARSCPNNACPRGAKCTPVDDLSGYENLE